MNMSITRLTEYARRIKAQEAIRPDAVRLRLINIELTRETAEWILDDLAKRGQRLQMCVDNPNTRPAKREKREAELSRLAYAVDAINHALSTIAACPSAWEEGEQAMSLIDGYSNTPKHYIVYTMIYGDMETCYKRLAHFRHNSRVAIHAQPYRSLHKENVIPQWQRDMARWANRYELFKATDFWDFSPRQGFVCRQYLSK